MSTAFHTRLLVEHRYGRTVAELQHDAAGNRRPGDPVLPIVLRRLAALVEITEQVRVTRCHLQDALLRSSSDRRVTEEQLQRHAADVEELELREQSEAEAIWDLLDVRLLLSQPGTRDVADPRTVPVDEELLDAAREVAACLPRLNRESLRHALREQGIHASNRRLGHVLRRLRSDYACW